MKCASLDARAANSWRLAGATALPKRSTVAAVSSSREWPARQLAHSELAVSSWLELAAKRTHLVLRLTQTKQAC